MFLLPPTVHCHETREAQEAVCGVLVLQCGNYYTLYRSYEVRRSINIDLMRSLPPPMHPLYTPYTSPIHHTSLIPLHHSTTPPLHHSTTPPLHRDLLIFARNEGADCVNALDVMANGQDSVLEALKFGLGDGYLQVCVCVCVGVCVCVCVFVRVCVCMCVLVWFIPYSFVLSLSCILYLSPVYIPYILYTIPVSIHYTCPYSLYPSLFLFTIIPRSSTCTIGDARS